MTAALPTTAVGVFQDPAQANAAVEALRQAGFGEERIGLVSKRLPEPDARGIPGSETRAAEGGLAGVLTGGTLGGLIGVAVALIPGVGHIIGAGILATAVGGAAAGVVAGGLVGTLIGMGIPEEEAHYYQGEFEAGRILVTVKADERYTQAIDILRRHGAYGKGSPLI